MLVLIRESGKNGEWKTSREETMVEGRQTIAVDLDGVLAQYDHWVSVEHIGPPIFGAKAFMRALYTRYYVMVYTCRASTNYNPGNMGPYLKRVIEDWLKEHDIPYHEVYQGSGKPGLWRPVM